MKRIAFGIVLLGQMVFLACHPQIRPIKAEPNDGFPFVFDGFIYVGMDADPQSHVNPGMNMPSVSPGHQYVFHHTDPFDSLVFARTVLPQRLQAMGYSLTQSVDQGSIAFMDPGGVVWGVKFAEANCTGTITAQPCKELTSKRPFRDTRLATSDFVLSLSGHCLK